MGGGSGDRNDPTCPKRGVSPLWDGAGNVLEKISAAA
jgi:hypothetical protein